MQADASLRALLALIALCLVILVVQGFTSPGSPGRRSPLTDEDGEVGRYRVLALRAGSPLLVRTDSLTGQTWRLELGDRRPDRRWEPFLEPAPPAAERETGPQPAASGEAAEGEDAPPAVARAAQPANPTPSRPRYRPARAGFADEDWPLLAKSLSSDTHPDIRAWAAEQLGRLDTPEAVPPLIGALGDDHPPVVVSAIEALVQTGDERAAPAIRPLLRHPNADVQEAAERALSELE